jgi:hypothetical protein
VIIPLSAAVIVTGIGMCIVEELEATPESGGITNKMRVCLLVPGNIAWDSCECGQLALTVQRIYPTRTFPIDASEELVNGGCMLRPLAVQVLVSILRCAPSLQSSGAAPTCDALLRSALEIHGDAYAVRRAVECCLQELKNTFQIFSFSVGGTNFVGPDGGCVGSELTFRFQLQ